MNTSIIGYKNCQIGMVCLSNNAQKNIDSLCYYPFTFGRHLNRINDTLRVIMQALNELGLVHRLTTVTLPHIGKITYFAKNGNVYVKQILWSPTLTRFYYAKSHFITFTKDRNIPSDHPSKYKMRTEDSFKCDNGFKVISRKYRGMELFNFMDLEGHIVSDIDFTQVKPFSEYKDMTARGYTPDRRCYMVYDDGSRTEVNETRNRTKSNITHLTETHLKQIIFESVWEAFNKAKYMP